MAKLHTHYITNAQKELKHAYIGLPEDDFQSFVQQALSNAKSSDDFLEEEEDEYFSDDDDDDDDDVDENGNGNISDTRNMNIEKWININDSELKKLLEVNVNVVIEPHSTTINHGSNVFDIEATLDNILGTSTSAST